jgi:2'-5' RNA ligase
VVDFGDGSRLKSDLALSTNLPADTINEIVDNVRKKLSKREQPVFPHDIATTTHFVMVERGLKTEGDKYMQFIADRRKSRRRAEFIERAPKLIPRRKRFMAHYLIEFRFFGRAKYELKDLIWRVDRKFRLGHATRRRPVPHITLVGPFSTEHEGRLISDFTDLCSKKQTMMAFKIKGLGTFEDTKTVFVDIEPNTALDTFRWRLSKKLRDYCALRPYDLEREYHFHATIAMKLSPAKFNLIKNSIEIEEGAGVEFCVPRITLIKNQKILCEYDFFLKRLLGREEAKSRFLLSKTFALLRQMRAV